MSPGRIGKGLISWLGSRVSDILYLASIFETPRFPFPSPGAGRTVFVTGNAGKLKEVREILAGGPQQPIEVESRELDCQS